MATRDDLARLALAEAVAKACRAMTNPRGGAKGAPNLRTEVDDALRNMYESAGVSQLKVEVNGEQVGTVSARVSKPEERVEPAVAHKGEFVRWLRESDGGFDALQRLVDSMPDRLVEAACVDGELPDGCVMRRVSEPAHWLGTTLRVDPRKVGAALGAGLPDAVAGLLSTGVEG